MAAAIPVVRGDIVLVDLSGALGDEKNNDASLGARPCVIIQNNAGNKYRSVTIVAPITDGATYNSRSLSQQRKLVAQKTLLLSVPS